MVVPLSCRWLARPQRLSVLELSLPSRGAAVKPPSANVIGEGTRGGEAQRRGSRAACCSVGDEGRCGAGDEDRKVSGPAPRLRPRGQRACPAAAPPKPRSCAACKVSGPATPRQILLRANYGPTLPTRLLTPPGTPGSAPRASLRACCKSVCISLAVRWFRP